MTTTLFIIAIVALIFLVVSAVLDGIFDALTVDAFDGGIGPVSISAFFVIFGFAGWYLGNNTGWSNPLVLGVATFAGALIFVPVAMMTKFLAKSESGVVRNDALIGGVGTVLTDIKVGAYGQVRINHSGHLATMTATASEEISSPTPVRVVSVTPPSIIHVERVTPLDNKSEN